LRRAVRSATVFSLGEDISRLNSLYNQVPAS
jgi:hypothetical protein